MRVRVPERVVDGGEGPAVGEMLREGHQMDLAVRVDDPSLVEEDGRIVVDPDLPLFGTLQPAVVIAEQERDVLASQVFDEAVDEGIGFVVGR